MSFGPELVYLWSRYLNEYYQNEYVDRVEGGSDWIAIRLSHSKKWLFLSWNSANNGCGIIDKKDLTFFIRSEADHPNPVLLFFKKHIHRSRLLQAEQLNGDRILVLSFSKTVGAGFSTFIKVILECSANRSNLILVDELGVVKETAKHIFPDMNRYRTILPGVPYTPPPPFEGVDPFTLPPDRLEDNLLRLKGIGTPLCRFIADIWQKRTPAGWLYLIKTTLRENTPLASLKVMRINQYLTVFATELAGIETETRDPLIKFGQLVMDSMKEKERSRLYSNSCGILDILIKRKQKHLKDLKKQLDNASSSESFRIAGELLMSNLYQIKKGVNSITLFSWEEEKEITIVLDPRLSAVQNAQKYFKKYRKTNIKDLTGLSSRIYSLERTIKELQDQKILLDLIEDINVLREASEDISGWISKREKVKKRSRKKVLPPHLKYIWRNHMILVGTNAKGNRFVTFDQARPWDLWFHVHEMPGSHVIVKQAEGKKVTDDPDVISLAASLAAYYSKARNSSKVQVDYTARKNVRHISGSGIAHVTYSEPATLMISPHYWKEHLSDNQ